MLVATLLLISMGAAIVNQPTDPRTDDIPLQPHDNPYAYLDKNGELAIDITEDNLWIDAGGINVDAFATLEALFCVTYDGNPSVEAWIEHEGTCDGQSGPHEDYQVVILKSVERDTMTIEQ
jgi:hypothetical protein